MAYSYITDTTQTQVFTGACKEVWVQVNSGALASSGTIKVIDGTSGTTANVATIDSPTTGLRYTYKDFKTGVRIVASGSCDVTVWADPK